MSAHKFHRTLLREYDVRGILDDTLYAADANALGRAFGTLVRRRNANARRVAVGYDGRLSSPMLEQALVDGLVSTGLEVMRVGLGPTPMLYFAVYHLECDGGVMVTGSHNPPDHNGFKMMIGKKPFYGDDIQELGRIAGSGDFVTGAGSSSKHDIETVYVDRLLRDWKGGRELKVVWDAGNGATGRILTQLVKRLPGQHRTLFAEIDGKFPNHHPDPTVPHNLVDLQKAVANDKADLGIAFDGDGDRIGVIDGEGSILWGDQLLALWAEELLVERPGATIIADVKASQVLFDWVASKGGKPLMWKTGHSLIKAKMAEIGSPLAGEMSGHIFFADKWYGFDDALYAAVRIIALLAKRTESLAALKDRLPKMVNTPELRFDCTEDRKFKVVDEVKQRLAAAGAKVDATDGVRVNDKDGWWLLRASNTQAVLVARCEAKDAAGLDRLKATLVGELKKSGIEAPAGL
jgi:phosphomannomutase